MKIIKLTLDNFTVVEHINLEFSNGSNVIIGEKNQLKFNFTNA